jgi:hypothetical protein
MEKIRLSFLPVNLFGGDQLRLGNFDLAIFPIHRTEKAGLISFMACRTDLLHLDEKRITVAIERNIFHRLGVTTGFAFHPKFLPGPAPEMRFTRLESFLE